jgi:hypothetical protein
MGQQALEILGKGLGTAIALPGIGRQGFAEDRT